MGWFQDCLNAKCYEPVQRNKDGLKWICHRFPIRDGISLAEVILRDFCRPNPLVAGLFARKDYAVGAFQPWNKK
jgi:hypothetical protein